MKVSITVTPIQPDFGPIVYTNDIRSHLPRIAELGYDAIELHIADPASLDPVEFRQSLDEYGLTLSFIGTGLAFGEDGLSWIDPDPEVRTAAVKCINDHVDFASEYGAPIAIGYIRGRWLDPDPVKAEEQKRLVMDCCRECAKHAEGTGVILAFEPINHFDMDYIHTIDEAIDFVKQVDSPAMGILADTYHMNIEEASMEDALKRAGKLLSHVHLVDNNRLAPGFGHIYFKGILGALREIGYDGYLSLEVLPEPSPDEAASRGIEYVKRILENLP